MEEVVLLIDFFCVTMKGLRMYGSNYKCKAHTYTVVIVVGTLRTIIYLHTKSINLTLNILIFHYNFGP